MASREDLHNTLCDIFGRDKVDSHGKVRVYFQAPSKLEYPCLIYQKADYNIGYGDDKVYRYKVHYTITYIGRNPDNEDFDKKMFMLPYCSFNRRFITDNLYHDVFDLYW